MKPFKTAQELGITATEREALLWVRRSLASGKIPDRRFDMRMVLGLDRSCATGCIGGWMWLRHYRTRHPVRAAIAQLFLGRAVECEASHYVRYREPPLRDLFFPDPGVGAIDPAAAVRAIDSFLMTGDPAWRSAVAPHPVQCPDGRV